MSSKPQLELLIADSYQELVSLLEWFALFGPIPTIIGGWAVHFYNSYFGSIDIDIVGPSHQGRFIDLIERYERTHNYEFTPRDPLELEVTTRKPVAKNGKVIGYMEIDACTFEDPKPGNFHEAPTKQLPYSMTAEKRYKRSQTRKRRHLLHPKQATPPPTQDKGCQRQNPRPQNQRNHDGPTPAGKTPWKSNKRPSGHNRPARPRAHQTLHQRRP